MITLGWILLMLGCIVLLIAAAGLFRLTDAVSRQHAATKAGTLGLGLILAGAALVGGDWAWGGRVLTILAIGSPTRYRWHRTVGRAAESKGSACKRAFNPTRNWNGYRGGGL